jgi:serine/threonine protein kinase
LNDGLFAVKALLELEFNNEARFRNESDQLRRFNGLIHAHLVTLLATFTFQGQYHFLFPYADYALDQYWERRLPEPRPSIEMIQWVAKQCAGIMAAMDTIHDPPNQNHLKEKGYGRHGDIKPDNILWFNSTTDPRGILVVSDLGLASFNRETSRSNIPNQRIPQVPGYRPPECDIKGGTISRAYDIWTLGCLFLELLTWLLGGWKSIQEFDMNRTTTFMITGGLNNIFFCLKKTKDPGVYVAQIKPEVTAVSLKKHLVVYPSFADSWNSGSINYITTRIALNSFTTFLISSKRRC